MVLVISTDVRRYGPLVGYIAVINILLGAVLLIIDIGSAMPSYWTYLEGPPIICVGALLFWLWRRAADEPR